MTPEQLRALAKIRKCLALAADTRGNADERKTAWRQAQALIEKHGLQLDRLMPDEPQEPPAPPERSPAWFAYWRRRTVAQALAAGVSTNVLCVDGWLVPG